LTCGNARGPASARIAFPAAACRHVAPMERVAVQMLSNNQRSPDNGPIISSSDTFAFHPSRQQKPIDCYRIVLGSKGCSHVGNMPQLYLKQQAVSHLIPMSLPFQGGYIYTVLVPIETECNNAVIVNAHLCSYHNSLRTQVLYIRFHAWLVHCRRAADLVEGLQFT